PDAVMQRPGEAPRMNGKFGDGFPNRAGLGKFGLLAAGGGNKESEEAVARGLKWVAKQQNMNKADPHIGSWECEGTGKSRVAATGIAVLAFLAAGHSDRAGDYRENVKYGVGYLVRTVRPEGDFGTLNMYEHAIATMALCEFYGMTKESKLPKYCQVAVDFIINSQQPAGGWSFGQGQAGNTSVTSWQIQALRSAHLAGFKVPEGTIRKAMAFLDSVQNGSTYGYSSKQDGSPATTAAGLLCRQYLGWSQKSRALVAGIQELQNRPPPKPTENGALDLLALYYATQVIHNYGGLDWQKTWNPGMRDLLVKWQVGPSHALYGGSWDPNPDLNEVIGGRLVTTCFALLTLEVYYRYPPVYKIEIAKIPENKEVVA